MQVIRNCDSGQRTLKTTGDTPVMDTTLLCPVSFFLSFLSFSFSLSLFGHLLGAICLITVHFGHLLNLGCIAVNCLLHPPLVTCGLISINDAPSPLDCLCVVHPSTHLSSFSLLQISPSVLITRCKRDHFTWLFSLCHLHTRASLSLSLSSAIHNEKR